MNGNEVKGLVSIPLSGLGWLGKGRYLNGDATFKVSLENGVLMVTAEQIQVKGVPIPESVMSQLRSENLAQDAYKDPETCRGHPEVREHSSGGQSGDHQGAGGEVTFRPASRASGDVPA